MRARFLGLVLVGLAAITVACGDGATREDATTVDAASIPGSEVVRGLSGLPFEGAPRTLTAEERELAEAVDHFVLAIERAHPGRLRQIAEDLRSRDGERMVEAKLLLDASLAEVASAEPTLLASSLRPQELLQREPTSLVDGGVQLLCEQPRGADGNPLRLGAVNGTYGDGRTGAGAAARDSVDLVDTTDMNLLRTLRRVDSGELVPNPESRLGAYAATRGYAPGTVGNAVHNAIGTIYVTFANYGEERIGRVFNSPEARALYDQPVASCAGRQMAMLEHQYWRDVAAEDPWSPGGRMGSAFNPTARDWLQRRIFDR